MSDACALFLLQGRDAVPFIPENSAASGRPAPRGGELATRFDEEPPSETVAHVQPQSAFLREAARASLRHAIDGLPREFREVIVLRELEGLSYQEISDVAGVPVGTVMSRLARARKRLQEALRPEQQER